MENNQFFQHAISHKDLLNFLIKAKKESTLLDTSEQSKINREEENFNDLIQNWTETSQKILLIMNDKDKVFSKNKNSKSLMALGAMGAHIAMALQAFKATDCDQ